MISPMQYLRMLTNSLIAGALVGAYVALLVLQLNPMVRLDSMAVARLMLTWLAFYGVHAAAFFYGLIVLRQLLAVEVRSPGWISLRLLAAFGTIAVSMSAIVTWLNLDGFRSVLGPDAASRMTDGALVVSLCAAICMGLALLQTRLQRGRGIAATVFGLVLVVSLAGPLYLRGAGESTPPPRTPVAAQLAPAQSSARVHDDSARRRVARFHRAECGRRPVSELRPPARQRRRDAPGDASSDAAGARVDRGGHRASCPYKTSVYSAARYVVPGSDQPLDLLPDFCFAQALVRLGLIEEEERASDAVRARPIWELLSGYGITAGVIDWPLTYPAHGVNGYLISDEFLHRDPASVHGVDGRAAAGVSAGRRRGGAHRAAERRARAGVDRVRGAAGIGYRSRAKGRSRRRTRSPPMRRPSRSRRVVRRAAARAVHRRPVSRHRCGRPLLSCAMRCRARSATSPTKSGCGTAACSSRYYTYLDGIVGRAMAALGPDDLLLVVSGFGMEPLSLGKRVLERVVGDRDLSGSHERAPDGFVIAYGRQVAKGNFPRASVVDIAPTVLYYFGLPIARDLDGFARTDIFTRSFTEQRPITFIPFYDR